MLSPIPPGWQSVLTQERDKAYFRELERFVESEQAAGPVYPPNDQIFAALELTPFVNVSVLLLGQDPYPSPGHAHGLAFSVQSGVRPPPSLGNMFKELNTDLQISIPKSGCLDYWARQGVLLLNTVLTVRGGQPLSHRGRGWEIFTDTIIKALSDRPRPVIFALWGGQARNKLPLIDRQRHSIITAAHPSPLSAHCGFFGSRPFSRINEALRGIGRQPINWIIRP